MTDIFQKNKLAPNVGYSFIENLQILQKLHIINFQFLLIKQAEAALEFINNFTTPGDLIISRWIRVKTTPL